MLKNLPRKYNPPGNGDRDMERPIYANKVEEMILAALGGSGKMTKHGIPSYSWRDNSSSDTRSSTSDSRDTGGNTNSGGNSTGGGDKGGLSPGFTGQRNLGLTTGKITGTSAYGPAGGNAVGGGAPGFENPQATARTLARMQPRVAPPVQAVPTAPIPIPRVKPPVPQVAPFLGPNANMINTLPQIGGTVPSQIQQAVNGLNYGPTSFPGTPNGPQVGGVTPGGNSILSQYQDTTNGGKFGSRSTQSLGTTPTNNTASVGGMERYADMTTGGKFGSASTQTSGVPGMFGPRAQQENTITAQAPAGLEQFGPIDHTRNLLNKPYKDAERISQAENAIVGRWYGNPQTETFRNNWDWTGLGQMDKTGQTVTPRSKPASLGLKNLPR